VDGWFGIVLLFICINNVNLQLPTVVGIGYKLSGSLSIIGYCNIIGLIGDLETFVWLND